MPLKGSRFLFMDVVIKSKIGSMLRIKLVLWSRSFSKKPFVKPTISVVITNESTGVETLCDLLDARIEQKPQAQQFPRADSVCG